MRAKALHVVADVAMLESSADGATLPAVNTALDLYQGQIVRLRPIFEDLLWDGLTLFFAKPKAGKSWLTLQLAICVSGGQAVAGLTPLETGSVLYAALEEPKARTMSRLRKLAPVGPWASNLHFIYELLPLMGGGAEQIEALIAKVRPRLVVIDTLTAVIKGGGKRESDVFRSQYAEASRIRRIAEDTKTAVIVVHHTRKGVSDGAIEAIAGTGGIAAAIDTAWLLKRKPEGEGTLEVLGREVEEHTLALRFEQDPFGWRVLGDDVMQLLNAERREVIALLREDGDMTPAQIAVELGKSRPAIRMLLKRMREDNQVRKQGLKYSISLITSYSVTERENE